MSSLPPALNFSETEEEIVKKWKEEDSFRLQNQLSIERGDEVCFLIRKIGTIGLVAKMPTFSLVSSFASHFLDLTTLFLSSS
jgi:hypothetical protein